MGLSESARISDDPFIGRPFASHEFGERRTAYERLAPLGRCLAWWSVSAFLLGMITGGLLLMTISDSWLWASLKRFPASAYWFAGAELLFSLACMLGIAGGWKFLNKWLIAALAFITVTNLLYHFPPLMTVIGKLASNPHFSSDEVIDRPMLLELMLRGEVLALSFHFGISSFAVSAIAVLHLLSKNLEAGTPEASSLASKSAGIAFVATLAQIPVGVWLLISLPGMSRLALMGKSLGASLAFMTAMVLSLMLLQRLLAVAIGDVERKNLRTIVTLTCVVVLLMTASLRLSRPIMPMPAETKTALSVITQG
jgi:hypothetical protein